MIEFQIFMNVITFSITWLLTGFLYYIALMELHFFFGKTVWLKASAYPFLIFWDCPMNLTLFTVICLDPPREALITQRMKRYRAKYEGKRPSELTKLNWWRAQLRWYICDRHLDRYDSITGDHC